MRERPVFEVAGPPPPRPIVRWGTALAVVSALATAACGAPGGEAVPAAAPGAERGRVQTAAQTVRGRPDADTGAGTPSAADTAPEPCARGETQSELTRCYADAARAAEARAAAVTDSARAVLKEEGRGETRTALDRAAAAWAAWRDAYCAATASVYEGGSMAPMAAAQCRALRAAEWETRVRDLLAEGAGGG